MGRRGTPYDNPKVESFMKTLKVEAVHPMADETFADVAQDLPRIDEVQALSNAVAATPQALSKMRGEVRLVAPSSLPNDGRIIAHKQP
jgi:transposase InsO family protein